MRPTLADIALAMELGLHPQLIIHLIDRYGSAEALFAASASDLIGQAQLKPPIAQSLARRKFHAAAEQELRWAQRNGIHILTPACDDYPPLLRECPDRPHILYVRGDPGVLQAPMLAMVGTRKINSYGLYVAGKLVQELAADHPEATIVSGLAFGVDVACHRAALAHGLRTIAVMATPIHQIYPSVHADIAEEIVARGGALITELSSTTSGSRMAFLQRNRIVAGMSAGTIVVQSPDRGGSMVTASLADGYDRPLLAPPGPLNDPKCAGTNALLRTLKARIVCSGTDIARELGWQAIASQPTPTATRPDLRGDQQRIYDAICASPRLHVEELEATLTLPSQQLLQTLLELEFAGYVRALPGNRYERFS